MASNNPPQSETMTPFEQALADLRHAYSLMLNGAVHASQGGIVTLAEGLIAPSIRKLEAAALASPAAPPKWQPEAKEQMRVDELLERIGAGHDPILENRIRGVLQELLSGKP